MRLGAYPCALAEGSHSREIYGQDEIDAMFDDIGGYGGYRIGIEPDGDWLFFVAGD